ncbi:nuclear transport factor 2 family protein [Leucobacter weissii]|uniref:Nuclear transport factor 2 family protein n=1 Tax=Leucobacter weissii TaxID=1983706 RepID=A0A939MQC7_9MICO|nr:nuclear transport factor 2 family protein [Leucobacter weissii]MBO1902676.1 nuclear transport factor 2 family protein [Leucobacter weissii]
MDQQRFDDYIARFNRKDATAFDDYLADDLHMQNGTLEYTGVQGMKDHYAKIWSTFTEELAPSDFVGSETNAAIRMVTYFTAERDDEESTFGPVVAGDRFEFRGVISYRLDEAGRFADILVAYNSFTAIRRDGTVAELGIPH